MSDLPDVSSAAVGHDQLVASHRAPRFALSREFIRLWLLARYGWSRGARPWLGVAMALATILVAAFLHFHILRPELWNSGDVYAALPITSELARLPMSLFFPTAYLPLWAACLQLVVVIGLGELVLGRWLTIGVAVTAHFGATLIARVVLDSLSGHLFALTPALARAFDAGPSAATTAVGACLLIAARMRLGALLLCSGLLIAALVAPGVDALEHMAALTWGLIAGALYCVVSTRVRGRIPRSAWRTRVLGVARAFRSPRSALEGIRGDE
ncbi:MAG: hypothetical protein WCA31_05055 [Acidimicrobiales bacterium]